ncbi:MAG: low molecular weight protein arginine phosphatase [Clostridia bacterium]|jgi:protein-tyrosine-phosphatase|nr:low molecular weight protein arginine phosphatase [Clostridia bacterium]MDD4275383.1 low molecular weight protein arginine phosphatase [Clostridia bacterium]
MIKSVLFVCTGNTCRSPMAERILKQRLHEKNINNIKVSSAGLYATPGQPMNEYAIKILKQHKIRTYAHKSKQLTTSIINGHNLVITMTEGHKNALLGYKNVVTLAEYIKGIDVADPYGQNIEAYKKVCEYLLYAMDEIIEKIIKD